MSLNDIALATLIQAKQYLKVDAANSLQVFAEYVGTGNGINKTFTLAHTPIEGSLKLYLDGALQTETTHYTISTATITFVTAPGDGKPVTAAYDYAAGDNTFESYEDELLEDLIEAATETAEAYTGRAFIQRSITETHIGNGGELLRLYRRPVDSITSVSYEKVDDFDGDGSTIVFTLNKEPMSRTYAVYVDGTLQTETTDYSISGKTLTFVEAPADDTLIIVRYNIELVLNTNYTEHLSIARLEGSWYTDYEYQVVYTAGSAATRAAIQALIPNAVLAVLLIVSDLYENRGDKIDSLNIPGLGSVTYKMPSRARELLDTLRVGARGLG